MSIALQIARHARRALAVSLAVGVAVAAAASGWSIQTAPLPAGAQRATFYGVSCAGPKSCTAVGFSANSTTNKYGLTLAERWDGTTWKVQPTPNPSPALGPAFQDVSCPSASRCLAVGTYADQNNRETPLAEHWNGTSWKLKPPVRPAGGPALLHAVTCTAGLSCTAVGEQSGDAGQGGATLAEHWNGTAWTIQPTPGATGNLFYSLLGVSCVSANACTAVGSHNAASGRIHTLAQRWNGTTWTTQPTPTLPRHESDLFGVSCTAPNACIAVGATSNDIAHGVTLAERWNGTSWKVQSTPHPSNFSLLNEVSCTAGNACTAAGLHIDAAGKLLSLVERWNGTSWKVDPTPNPVGASRSPLNGVSCTSATACTVVGYSYTPAGHKTRTLVERHP